MFAGLEKASGDYVVIIDADLQDPPELIIEMYETLQTTDYDCVASRRVSRKGESKIRSFFARMFYKVIRKISKVNIMDGARDFRMMTRQMTDAVLSLREYNRFSKGIFAWVGFNTKWIPFETATVKRALPSGRSGGCWSMPLTAYWHFLRHRWHCRQFWDWCSVSLPLS